MANGIKIIEFDWSHHLGFLVILNESFTLRWKLWTWLLLNINITKSWMNEWMIWHSLWFAVVIELVSNYCLWKNPIFILLLMIGFVSHVVQPTFRYWIYLVIALIVVVICWKVLCTLSQISTLQTRHSPVSKHMLDMHYHCRSDKLITVYQTIRAIILI